MSISGHDLDSTTDHPGPVFVGGEGRSGTTLLSVMLDSHPALCVGPELHFRGPENLGPYIVKCVQLRMQAHSLEEWHALRLQPELYHGVHFVNRCERFGVAPDELRSAIELAMAERGTILSKFSDRTMLIDRLGRDQCRRRGAAIWGLKVMRDIRIADQYLAAWPNAQFIHLIRDGRDVAASQMIDHSTWGYADIETAARNWRDLIHQTRRRSPRNRLLEIRYEDLVTNAADTMQAVLRFIGVDWHEHVLRHHEQNHSLFNHPHGHASNESVRRPVNASAIGRHQRDLKPEQIETYEAIAGPMLLEMRYSCESLRHQPPVPIKPSI